MSYRVDYHSEEKEKHRQGKGGVVLSALLCFLLFLIFVQLFWPEGQQALRAMILPGASENVWSAADDMVRQIREGEPVADTVDAFCRGVLQDAGLIP